jgi:hypothetical protein
MRIVRVIVFGTLAWLLAVQFTALAGETASPKSAPPIHIKAPAPAPRVVKPKPSPTPVETKKAAAPRVHYHERYKLPEVYHHGKVIDVSIANQQLTAWKDGAIVYRFYISTGRAGYETPTGHYKILYKAVDGWSRKYQVVMPWMMQFYHGYTFHQLAHERGSTYLIGRGQLGSPASHGCVREPEGLAETMYHWTPTGTPVWIH